jgi:hypothetical protein
VTCVGRGVPSYRSIVLRRVVVRVAVARGSRVDGGADGRQLGGSRGVGRALVVRMGVMGMVVAVVVLLVRQGDGVRRLMWLRSCAKSSWCLRRRVVSCLPLGPCHHSFTRVAVHGRATSTAKPQRAQERSTIGGGQQRSRRRLGLAVRAVVGGRGDDGCLLGWCVVSARKLPWAVVMLGTATTRWAVRGSAEGRCGGSRDHTEPLAVSSSVRSPSCPLTKPEPAPSCVKIHAPQRQRPINALHMGRAVQHAAAINSRLLASCAASPAAFSALRVGPCWFPSAPKPFHLLVCLRGSF